MLKSASSRASSSSVKSNNSQVSSEAPVKLSRFSKPSDKVNPKTSFQLGNTKSKSAFSSAYSKGTIPCRLQHGSVKNSLVWTVQVETIKNFDPLLILFFQGLIEVDHPFNFIVGQGITDLLNSYGAYEKTVSVLPFLVMPLRLALMSKNRVVMLGAIKAFDSLVRLVDSRIIPHLNLLLPPLAQRALSSDGTEVMNVLRNIEIAVVDSYANGLEGRSTLRSDCDLVLKIIKQKIPTYVSVYF